MASLEIKMDIADYDGETQAQNDTEKQSEDPDDPIYRIARDCSEMFKKCLETRSEVPRHFPSSEIARFIQEYQSRFDAWVSFLRVFDGGQACLDRRLQKHPALQDMFIRLLDILRRNIFLVGECNYQDLEPTAAEAQGSSNTIHAPDHIMKDALPSNLNIAFSSIEEAITRLNKLGIAIRLSSRSTVVARARNFASQNPDLIRLSEFNDRAYFALQSLYPNASESLRQQLADAMTDRYARLQYEFYRTRTRANLDSSANAPSLDPSSGELSITPEKSLTESAVKENYDPTSQIVERQRITVNRRDFPQSSIDTSRLHANLEGAVATETAPKPKPPKTLTVNTNRQREPPCPEFKDDEDYTHCDWCFQIIDRSLLHMKRGGYTGWSDEGRRHYRNDLQPYVCIAEGCSKSRPTYSSSRDWFEHMTSTHSKYWSQNIQDQSPWACPFEHESNSAYVFSRQDELYNHFHLQHETEKALNMNDEIESLARQYRIESLRQASSCPLCWFAIEGEPSQDDESDEVISSADTSQGKKKHLELHRKSIKRVKLLSGTIEANKVATSWAMGSHIAEHLHYLMIVSLQLMSAIEGASYGEGDTQSDSGFPNSHMSALGRDELKNRLDDLPSDVQGSIDWSHVDENLPVGGQGEARGAKADGVGRAMATKLERTDYSVGFICAMQIELVAICAILDETHPQLEVRDEDINVYEFGRIGGHNVVIARLPGYGITSAAAIAAHMQLTFTGLRFGLMVGIGGGAPSERNDIRLGDVVVSQRTGIPAGIVQYDFGKAMENGEFVRPGVLNAPPSILLSAVASIKTKDPMELGEKISNIAQKIEDKDAIFQHPGQNTDRLFQFQADYNHDFSAENGTCKSCDSSSGSQVIKHGVMRDRISAQTRALCLEIEGASLMNDFPCLVIRGICDYSDSHKNKRWQPYAALVAAVYAKELLLLVPTTSKDGAEANERGVSEDINVIIPFRMPFPRNQTFFGRAEELKQIYKYFSDPRTTDENRCYALRGTGGTGKTQIALEYSYRYHREYTSTFWVSAASEDTTRASFVHIMQRIVDEQRRAWPESADYEALGSKFGIPGLVDSRGIVSADLGTTDKIRSAVLHWLQLPENNKWLLIFDNADDLETFDLQYYLPSHGGAILITSRKPMGYYIAEQAVIEGLDQESAVKMISSLVPSLDTSRGTRYDIITLVKVLNFLPLAIRHAGCYMHQTKVSPADYMSAHEEDFLSIQTIPSTGWDYGDDIAATTCNISFSRVEKTDEEAAELLLICSYLNPAEISEALWGDEQFDRAKVNDMVLLLASYSLVEITQFGTFSVHPVVQSWARECLDQSRRLLVIQHAVMLIGKASKLSNMWRRSGKWESQEEDRRIVSHLEYLHRYSKASLSELLQQERKADFQSLLEEHICSIAGIFRNRGRYDEAMQWYELAPRGREKALGRDHPDTLTVAKNLLTLIRETQD
ncbi:hypothetical protein H072_7246 [Dactylellina haptotyla CBS 200.50]|uniref:Orc1-like AAA ATPase domain-containing protein n=1 Tax=Dactylellina haptotyla (strain CBS 200.50) TaxID=1284197 RepID=S8AD14_DACHA|nr:hypothetical protein H072_7246 [Dactylellina haptotyla CBS 200.50]